MLDRTERAPWAVLSVRGEVDMATAPALAAALSGMVAAGDRLVVVDLSGTDFIDSSGLGVLVVALRQLRRHGGRMRVVCSSPRVCKVFEIAGFDRVVAVHASLDDACVPA